MLRLLKAFNSLNHSVAHTSNHKLHAKFIQWRVSALLSSMADIQKVSEQRAKVHLP